MNVAVFASGRGSNVQAILDAIRAGTLPARVSLLVSSSAEAGAVSLARAQSIAVAHLDRRTFASEAAFAQAMLQQLRSSGAELVALAGYVKHVPPFVVAAYRNRIVNIHPALLPAFGGKGMYGRRVHEAVLAAGVKVSGATVHLVDEEYDRGPIVAQQAVPVLPGDTPESLAARVLTVEHTLYPSTLRAFAEERVKVDGRKAWIME